MSQSRIQEQKRAVAASAAAQQSDNIAHALAGAGGGILSMVLTYPLITLSTRAQVESKRAQSTTMDAVRRIVQREGFSGLYSGLESALFGISVTNFVYYYWFEWTRAAFEKAAVKAGRASKKLTTAESMIAGAIAGSATVLITNPIWVVNTRMTARKSDAEDQALPGAPEKKARASTIGTLMDLIRREGPTALFAGVLPALVLVINPILQYTIFEQLKNIVERRRRMTPKDAFYLGALGKILATTITYPYITVKSQMHVASKDGPKESLNGSLKRIISEEGYTGLYKGIVPKVTQSAITAAFLFAFKDVFGSSVFGPIRALNNVNALLQNRELGGPVKRQLRTKVKSEFSLLKTWKGASNDVNVLAWSPDGTKFAAGATAQCDEGNMEYNRGNNLVIGDLTCNRLEEVPGHYIIRPPGRAASQRALSDNRLFMSVTAMQWFDDTLFTASYDNTVKLWRSVVRVYEPLKWKSQTIEFECPALDINDITFCPMNSYYVTASCTNGVTYVWDYRKRDQVLLELSHGEPLNQLDELLEREQDDVGVRMALWGDEINQFYTGASDGIVKQWNILRAQEDALTKNVFGIEEEIMCGAFSSDKSNLLIGDAGGGIHILSTSNSSPHEGRDPNEDERKMQFRHAAQPPCDDHASDSESGLVAARKLLNSGKLKRHPVFGVGQGPHYDGPYAGWARPGNPDKPHLASLRPDVKMRQLDGPAPKDRIGLDEESRQLVEAHIQLARIRNQRRNEYKRKRTVDVIDLCSDEEDNRSPERQAQSRHIYIGDFMGIANLQCEVIDLTGDTDTDSEENASIARARSPCFKFPKVDSSLETLEAGLEDDFWWPDSGQVNPNFPQEA
ncbi:hypothetical protein KXV95_000990 [Aspergillus fumigatus]|uniref:Uncharacterized protein n=1 Tax=Aspergillus fumigatus TaxID=746128 RepID=A0A229Y2E1_ASPFM|nr:hypothetical protein KXX51_001344 [Aspergillus fumigatus]KAH1442560.1 hypothetical protein KXX68_000877 [Aspergillus fumigatus]KAH1464569.1 hypothetical protein KXX53_002623 [Aspergillus fumigatus]KAH1529120.1 hypothetical protein KXX18_008959 [Aspergillus fumigatus]KAH1543494.1 hypothetical protein KXX61_007628 [Aspergillus fumigatus]